MIKILANDGISDDGKLLLEEAGYEVVTERVPNDELVKELPKYDVIIVRSATKISKEVIDACRKLKLIARGGFGTENINEEYATSKGIKIIDTPIAPAQSVAELVFAHLFSISRNLQKAHQEMPTLGDSSFNKLKKAYSSGFELRGKTIGILGFGRIGQAVARIALGLGMRVVPVDTVQVERKIDLNILNIEDIALSYTFKTVEMDEMLSTADIITVHVPYQGKAIVGQDEFSKMKNGVVLINAARGGVVDEAALLENLEIGKVRAAGIDVFENEPTPNAKLLSHPNVSSTPHIGASTVEAQAKVGLSLADKIIAILGEAN